MHQKHSALCALSSKTWILPHTICVPLNYEHDKRIKVSIEDLTGKGIPGFESCEVDDLSCKKKPGSTLETLTTKESAKIAYKNNIHIEKQIIKIKQCVADRYGCALSGEFMFQLHEKGYCQGCTRSNFQLLNEGF